MRRPAGGCLAGVPADAGPGMARGLDARPRGRAAISCSLFSWARTCYLRVFPGARPRRSPGWSIPSPSATRRGARRTPPVQVERPAGRTTWTGGGRCARLALAGGDGMDPTHPSPPRQAALTRPLVHPGARGPAGGTLVFTVPAGAPGPGDRSARTTRPARRHRPGRPRCRGSAAARSGTAPRRWRRG